MKEFSENLARLRRTAKVSAESLAHEAGISKNSVLRYESGEANPTLEKATLVADYFGVSLDFLVGHKPTGEFTDQERLLEENAELKEILMQAKQGIEDFEFERGKLK